MKKEKEEKGMMGEKEKIKMKKNKREREIRRYGKTNIQYLSS